MKVVSNKGNPLDHEEIPYIAEEILNIDEYVELFKGRKPANDIWFFLLKIGFSVREIDDSFRRVGII